MSEKKWLYILFALALAILLKHSRRATFGEIAGGMAIGV
jgi:hypothetical protein